MGVGTIVDKSIEIKGKRVLQEIISTVYPSVFLTEDLIRSKIQYYCSDNNIDERVQAYLYTYDCKRLINLTAERAFKILQKEIDNSSEKLFPFTVQELLNLNQREVGEFRFKLGVLRKILFHLELYNGLNTIDFLIKQHLAKPDCIEVYMDYVGNREANMTYRDNRVYLARKKERIIWGIDVTKTRKQTTITKITCNFRGQSAENVDYTDILKYYWGEILTVDNEIIINFK